MELSNPPLNNTATAESVTTKSRWLELARRGYTMAPRYPCNCKESYPGVAVGPSSTLSAVSRAAGAFWVGVLAGRLHLPAGRASTTLATPKTPSLRPFGPGKSRCEKHVPWNGLRPGLAQRQMAALRVEPSGGNTIAQQTLTVSVPSGPCGPPYVIGGEGSRAKSRELAAWGFMLNWKSWLLEWKVGSDFRLTPKLKGDL
jgi:hypothetical protein